MKDLGADPALAKAEPVARLGPSGFDPGELARALIAFEDEYLPSGLRETPEWQLVREHMADALVASAGKPFHWSDCATSSAPAETPRPCDCASPWQPMASAPLDGTPILVSGGTREHPDSMGGPEPFKGISIARWNQTWKQWEGEATSHEDCYSHEPAMWQPLPAIAMETRRAETPKSDSVAKP
jgi:hypothetical protein